MPNKREINMRESDNAKNNFVIYFTADVISNNQNDQISV